MPLAMFCSIFRNAVSNMTTYERSNRNIYPHLRGGNPFDQGLIFNLKEFFGRQPYALLERQTFLPTNGAGVGSVNWRRKPLFTKQSLDYFYPFHCAELQPLVQESAAVQAHEHAAYAPDYSRLQVLYDAGYPPLPSDAVGTEV